MHRYQSKPTNVTAMQWGHCKLQEVAQIVPYDVELYCTNINSELVYRQGDIVGLIKQDQWLVVHATYFEVMSNVEFEARYVSVT